MADETHPLRCERDKRHTGRSETNEQTDWRAKHQSQVALVSEDLKF